MRTPRATPTDAEVIAAGTALRLIATMTITPEQIDVAAATARRIPVTPIPTMVTEATADLAFGLVRAGVFPGAQSARLEGPGVSGGFGMRLLYADPRPLAPAEGAALGLSRVALGDLLAEADFVSVHVPLGPATRHLIGAPELARMKPTACLVNTSRGPARGGGSRRLRARAPDRARPARAAQRRPHAAHRQRRGRAAGPHGRRRGGQYPRRPGGPAPAQLREPQGPWLARGVRGRDVHPARTGRLRKR